VQHCLVGSEMCIRDRVVASVVGSRNVVVVVTITAQG
jgi:hypothetical protein